MKHYALSQWITVDHSVARSVNLDRDAADSRLLERFQITPNACDMLHRLADALNGEPVNAWSLTGPYGSGKSAFCNFLIALSCGDSKTRALCFSKLRKTDHQLAARMKAFVSPKSRKASAISVRAVSHYESLNSTLVRGLSSTLEVLPARPANREWKQLRERVHVLCGKEWPATRDIVDAFGVLVKVTGRPIFLVVDEFGKNLEYQAHHAEQGDIFALQALAESKSVFLWVCLHQAFSAYSGALSRVQREEWQKVQGRFEDRPYVEPPTRSFGLIRDALSITPPDSAHKQALNSWARGMAEAMSGIALEGLKQLGVETFKALYPFHPLAVYLMGELTRRFAQNDRTIFSFLSSGEQYAFAGCLQRLESGRKDRLPTLGLDALYDYFSETGVLRHSDRSENQRWIEIHTIISSHGGLDPDKTKLLKTIGVLNLLSSLPGVLASEDMINFALATSYYGGKRETIATLRELAEARVLIHREYAREYRLWEGSDFDLDQEVMQARGRVALRPVAETLEEIALRPNLVAARHSIQTGTLREFAVRWCTEDDLPALIKRSRAEGDVDGTVWLMLGKQKNIDHLFEVAKEGNPVIVGYAPCLEQVKQLMLEAAAAREACNAPQLERDGVARKEAHYRAAYAAQSLVSFLNDVFSPDQGQVTWFADGAHKKIRSQRELSAVASDLCDRIYAQCPRINNEMLNVERISSIAAAARNKVAEALANQSDRADLGFTGFGPEVAIYRTVFKETGLHRKNSEGEWVLTTPNKRHHPQFAAVWDMLNQMLEDADQTGQAVPVRKILDTLKQPPYGLREGPAPLLLSHYLLVHADEVAIYEENVFKPFFGDAEIILVLRRPELFSLRRYKSSGVRSEVIRIYYQVINTELELANRVRNQTMLSVVVPLTEFYKSLPEYTRATHSISTNALRLRNAIANARDPQQLLFRDIPEALGFPPIEAGKSTSNSNLDAAELQKALWSALTELRDAFLAFIKKIRGRFVLAISNVPTETSQFDLICNDLREKAAPLVNICLDAELKPVLAALAVEKGVDGEWLLQVAAIIMKKPVHAWQDTDIEPFAIRVEELRERIRQLHDLKRLADRQGQLDGMSRFVGITLPDGGIIGKTVQIPATPSAKTEETLKLFEKLDKDTRASILASLLETMEKKGDFQ